jgi:hypothetical protein
MRFIDLRSDNLPTYRLCCPDRKGFTGSVDHGWRHSRQAVHTQDAFNLGEQAVDKAEIASTDPDGGRDRFRIRDAL